MGEAETSNAPEKKTPRRKRRLAFNRQESVAFQTWYGLYPRKEGRGAAWRAWENNECEEHAELLIEALRKQVSTPGFFSEERRYQPLPATWINGARWEDEVEPAAKPAAGKKKKFETKEEVAAEIARLRAEGYEVFEDGEYNFAYMTRGRKR